MSVTLLPVRCEGAMTLSAMALSAMVRVGLIEQYSGKNEIRIYTTNLCVGYESNGEFTADTVISSSTGFVFTPDDNIYYAASGVFTTFDAAKSASETMKEYGAEAYPVMIKDGCYKVYVTSGSVKAANSKSNFYFTQTGVSPKIMVTGKGISFIIDAESDKTYPQFAAIMSNGKGDYVINLGKRQYRGRIEIGRYNNADTLTAVNIVDVEEYLYGVVPCEMNAASPMEALMAQAICARSYAKAVSVYDYGYTLVDTTQSQVYKGYLYENKNTTQAVDDTKGRMIYYNNQVVKAYYFSTSGGRTESGEDAWSMTIPYVNSAPDILETQPEKEPWIIEMSRNEVRAAIYDTVGDSGNILDISTEIKTQSGRVYSLKIMGKTTKYLYKSEISSALNLPSTKFNIIKYGDVPDKVWIQSENAITAGRISQCYVINGSNNVTALSGTTEQYIVMGADNMYNYAAVTPEEKDTYYFAGMGYGHGVGMSQSGAISMAEEGYSCDEIIMHYFNNVEIK